MLDPKRGTEAQKLAQNNQPAYERHKDVLYYKVEDSLNPLRLCVARRTSQLYLCYYYHMRNNSHSAPSAMAAAIKKHYWWPTDLCLTAESTARPYPTRHTPVLMLLG